MANELTVKQESDVREEETRPGRTYVPNVEIRETDDALWLWADMPGVAPENLDVNLEDSVLTVTGEVVEPDSGWKLRYREYGIGGYTRRFTLSDKIDQSGIEATLVNGVLTVRLPKADALKPRKVLVKAA